MREAAQLLRSMALTIVTSLLLYVLNTICSRMRAAMNGSSICLPFMPKHIVMSSYEMQIAQHIIRPLAIAERLDDIGGLAEVKEEIRSQLLLPLKYPKVFFSDVKALHPARGILLYGPPGTGKTMLARAIAAEAGVPFISLSLSNLEDKFFGESSKLLSATFSLAAKLQPCVLFFDEIDGMIRTRSEHDQSCVYGFKTEFLTHMDGIKKKETDAVIVIGCTNCESKLDPAVRRRLPRQYKVDLPSPIEIVQILKLHLSETSISAGDLRGVVRQLRSGCSGSDVADIVQTAWSMRMVKLTRGEHFLRRLEANATATEVAKAVDALTVQDLLDAMKRKGVWRGVDDPRCDDAEEMPPPE